MCVIFGVSKKRLRRVRPVWRHKERSQADSEDGAMLPDDVSEGHFAVITLESGERKRFVMELEDLSNPKFLRLLEMAREEFGFRHSGPLVVPCKAEEVQRILEEKIKKTSWF